MVDQFLVKRIWNLCNVLRDEGVVYYQHIIELSYLLFLKILKETGKETNIPEECGWDRLRKCSSSKIIPLYKDILLKLGNSEVESIREIFKNVDTKISRSSTLEKIISSIDELEWFDNNKDSLGDLYEALLEKNAVDKKSGAGQYFTPRVITNLAVELLDPCPGERCSDPASGTFGFMIAAHSHIVKKTNRFSGMSSEEINYQLKEAFSGCEIVSDTYKIALMNAIIHGIDGKIYLGDTLSELGGRLKDYDVVISNPPFGSVKGSLMPVRKDLSYPSTNKQLNFLQHIYGSMKPNGKSRAAVIVCDNVLFQGGDGKRVRNELLDKCSLHTILRLPTGIFYSRGIKTNILFLTRGNTDVGNTKGIWFYDLRSGSPVFGKKNTISEEYFDEFVRFYKSNNIEKEKYSRATYYSREEILELDDNLDLGLISCSEDSDGNISESIRKVEDLLKSMESVSEIFRKLLGELKAVEGSGNE